VPGGAVDLCPVGHVEHPQPLARPGGRQRPLLLSRAAAARGRAASTSTGSSRTGHPRTLSVSAPRTEPARDGGDILRGCPRRPRHPRSAEGAPGTSPPVF
jgi:hypothetical protein